MKCKTKQEYLEKLELRVSAREARDEDLARLSQMAAKTNQFNATTIRRNEKDFEAIIGSDYYKVFVFETRDVYAEQGIVAYVIVNVNDKTDVRITDFVMSCRVMGRTLEHYIVSYLEEIFGFRPEIDFVPTDKNLPFKEFLNSLSQNQVSYYRPFMV
jgi:FkbH-like protein